MDFEELLKALASRSVRELRAQLRNASAEQSLEQCFPGLRRSPFTITSPRDKGYNCVAWAADCRGRWWWPSSQAYWPEGIPCEVALAAFLDLFESRGYEECSDGEHEPGVGKVGIFAKEGVPTHAARQLPSGRWSSKCGELEDVEHELRSLEGTAYGTVVAFLSRPDPPR